MVLEWLSNPEVWASLVTLTALEIVLGIDNLVFLAILAARAFRGSPRAALRERWFLVSLALIVVYALVDEYHQSFVPSRTGTIYDSLIDMLGGLAALIIVRRRDWFGRASNSPV